MSPNPPRLNGEVSDAGFASGLEVFVSFGLSWALTEADPKAGCPKAEEDPKAEDAPKAEEAPKALVDFVVLVWADGDDVPKPKPVPLGLDDEEGEPPAGFPNADAPNGEAPKGEAPKAGFADAPKADCPKAGLLPNALAVLPSSAAGLAATAPNDEPNALVPNAGFAGVVDAGVTGWPKAVAPNAGLVDPGVLAFAPKLLDPKAGAPPTGLMAAPNALDPPNPVETLGRLVVPPNPKDGFTPAVTEPNAAGLADEPNAVDVEIPGVDEADAVACEAVNMS